MKKWIEEETQILKDNYAVLGRKDLCLALPDRTWIAIQMKSFYLKLTWPTAEQRFWKYVDKKQCWNWTGACNNKGYGQICVNGKKILTHRFSYEIHFGKVPDGMCVLHKCDNPLCVNPNHLFLGTKVDNNLDRDNKNRQVKGENNGRSKLTEDQAKEIRRLCCERKLTGREIAKMFNVSSQTISCIYNNKTWRHVI